MTKIAMLVLAAGCMTCVVAAPAALAESRVVSTTGEKIDNESYKNWAKFKVGTSVKLKAVSDIAGNKSENTMTYKLVELTAEKAVIEMGMSMKMGDQTMDMPAQKLEQLAKIEKVEPTGEAKDAPKPETGEEEVSVGGKKYKAKWSKLTMEQNGMKTTTKSWTSEEVPGMLLKSETTMEGAMSGTTSMELVEMNPA